jgi:cytochrome c oxidase subunit 2
MSTNKAIVSFVVGVLIIAGAAWYFTGRDENPQSQAQTGTTTTQGGGTSTSTGTSTTSSIRSFDVTGENYEFSDKEIRVKRGETVRINFTSQDGFHDLVVEGYDERTPQLSTGQSATIEFVADQTGTFTYYCSVGNHRAMGMEGKLIVE